ncbi:hypothetical protein [Rubripirellula tenax]|nr:hypothetical protein [Rubripirellula tenax]
MNGYESSTPIVEDWSSIPIIGNGVGVQASGTGFSLRLASIAIDEHCDRATSCAQSDNGSVQRVAGEDLQANGIADHRHSVATVGYPPSWGDPFNGSNDLSFGVVGMESDWRPIRRV